MRIVQIVHTNRIQKPLKYISSLLKEVDIIIYSYWKFDDNELILHSYGCLRNSTGNSLKKVVIIFSPQLNLLHWQRTSRTMYERKR